MTATTIHDQAYEFYSWEQLGQSIFTLAQQVLADAPKIDRIVALAKGGLTFSRSLVDFLKVENISTVQIEFYTGIGTTKKTPVITQSLPVTITDQHILIFDDIVDKGDTMQMAHDYMRYHGAASITTAALIKKPWSQFQPNYFAKESTAWVIFPNEIRETIQTLTAMWQKKGDSTVEIKKQLKEIGFGQAEIALFSNLE